MKFGSKLLSGLALVVLAGTASAQSDTELNRLLSHIREDKTPATVDALRKMRPGVIPRLIQKAKSGPRDSRLDAIYAIACVGSHEQYEFLMHLIVDKDEAVQREASDAINGIVVHESYAVDITVVGQGGYSKEERERASFAAWGGPDGSPLRRRIGLIQLRVPVLNYLAKPTDKSGELLMKELVKESRSDEMLDPKEWLGTEGMLHGQSGIIDYYAVTEDPYECARRLVWSERPDLFARHLVDRQFHYRSALLWSMPVELASRYRTIIRASAIDRADSVRRSAIWLLTHIERTEAEPLLVALTHDPIPTIRSDALNALQEISLPTALDRALVMRNDPLIREPVLEFVSKVNAASCMPTLRDWLNSKDRGLANSACKAIGGAKTVPSLSLIVDLIRRGPSDLKASAVGTLSNYEAERVMPILLETLDDKDPSVVEEACFALERLGDRRALPRLRQLLSSKRSYEAWAAKVAVDTLSRKSGPPPNSR